MTTNNVATRHILDSTASTTRDSLGGSSGGYASLTGPGETTTPGDLIQEGGFTIDDIGGGGISLIEHGTGGVNIFDYNHGIRIEEIGRGVDSGINIDAGVDLGVPTLNNIGIAAYDTVAIQGNGGLNRLSVGSTDFGTGIEISIEAGGGQLLIESADGSPAIEILSTAGVGGSINLDSNGGININNSPGLDPSSDIRIFNAKGEIIIDSSGALTLSSINDEIQLQPGSGAGVSLIVGPSGASLPSPSLPQGWGLTQDGHICFYPSGGPWTLVI